MDDRTAHEQHRAPARRPSSRRSVFGGVLGLGVALPVLAACGSGEEDSSAGSGSSASPSTPLTTTTGEVPVGGGTIFEEPKVVVTQPTEGEFRAFSATCTHQGCLVTEVTDGGIDCACHGSVFSIEDGSVVEGPAEQALAEMTVTVEGDSVTIA